MASTGKQICFICEKCGSKLVTRDAWAEWDQSNQQWVLGAAFDYTYCHDCKVETNLLEVVLQPST